MNVVDGGVQNVRTALKRRGILAGAAAFLAMGLAKASEQVARAADGGNLILGSAGDANNTASSTTRLFTGGNPGFRVVASVPTAAAIRGEATPSGSLSGVAGLVGSTAASSQPVAPSGVFGRGDDAGQLGVYGFSQGNIGLRGDSGANYGVYGTSTLTALRGEASGAGVGVVGVALNPGSGGTAGFFLGDVTINGNFTATGIKSAVVKHADGTLRRMYCNESPDSVFEDFGNGRLVNGRALVRIDPDFASLVVTDNYDVFIQEYGETNGLFVATRTPIGFEVREKGNGTSTAAFGYRIVGKRKDVQASRLQRFTMPRGQEVKPSLPGRARPD